MLQYVLEELAPVAYNRGVSDAQRFLQDRAVDLEGACHETEFGYWNKGRDRPKRGRG